MYAQPDPPQAALPSTNGICDAVLKGGGKPAVLDPEVYSFLRDTLKPENLASIYAQFLDHTRLRIQQLPTLDSAELHAFAHTLNGTAGMLGAQVIAARVTILRNTEPGSGELQHIVQQLSVECDQLQTALLHAQVQL